MFSLCRFSLVLGFFCSLFLASMPAEAQSRLRTPSLESKSDALRQMLSQQQVTIIKTETIRPLSINFLPSLYENQLEGKVFAAESMPIDGLSLKITSPNGETLYENEVEIDKEIFKSEGHTFRIQVPETGLAENSTLSVEGKFNETALGVGSQKIPVTILRPQYLINNLQLDPKQDNTVDGVFSFQNLSNLSVQFQPLVKIASVKNGEELLIEREALKTEIVKGKQTKTIKFNLTYPETPGLYRVELIMLGKDQKAITGVLAKELTREGVLGAIESIDIDYDEVLKKATIQVRGLTSGIQEETLTQIELIASKIGSNGSVSELEVNNLNEVVNQSGNWNQVFEVEGVDRGGSLFLEAKILNGNQTLGTKKRDFDLSEPSEPETKTETEFITLEKPIPVIDPEMEEVLDPVNSTNKWWFWGGIIFVIILLVFLKLVKKKPEKFMLWALSFAFASSLFFTTTASASLKVFWFHPVTNWSYNPSASGDFANFEIVNFQGRIFNVLTQEGLFFDGLNRVVVRFFDPTDATNDFYVESTSYTTTENKEYLFEVDAPTSLPDGDWSLQVFFQVPSGWYATDWRYSNFNEVSGEWDFDQAESSVRTVGFDRVAPTVNFVYDTVPAAQRPPVYSEIRPIEGDANSGHLSDLDNLRLKIQARKILKDKITPYQQGENPNFYQQRLFKIFKRNEEMQRLRDMKNNEAILIELVLNNPGNQSYVDQLNAIQAQIGVKQSLLQALSGTINNLTNDMGINIPQALFGNIDTGSDIPNVNVGDALVKNAPTNPNSIQSQINDLETQIQSLEPQILSDKNNLKNIKGTYKNQAVSVSATCTDNQGCHQDNLDFEVRGNFCDDSLACNTSAARQFQVCDKVGNCTTPADAQISIDWYDPVTPNFISAAVEVKDENQVTQASSVSSTTIASAPGLYINLNIDDPVSNKSTDPTLYDSHACGTNPTSDFFHRNSSDAFCTPSEIPCALSSSQRGYRDLKNGAACAGQCAPGFLLDGSICVPGCDFRLFDGCFPFRLIGDNCITSNWLPETSSQPLGQTFIQTSNCGASRSAVGTGAAGSVIQFLDGKNILDVEIYDVNSGSFTSWSENFLASWFTETKDDADGTCSFVSGPDDRCGESQFPQLSILVLTDDGFYIFDLFTQTLWMRFDSANGKAIPGGMTEGNIEMYNGQIFIGYKRSGSQGGLTTLDFVADKVRFWSTNNGLAYTGNKPGNMTARDVTDPNWSQDTLPGQQLKNARINELSIVSINNITYLAAATEKGITLFRLSDGKNMHLNYADNASNSYENVTLTAQGDLWYQWDYSGDSYNRIWKLEDFPSLPFDSSTITGVSTADSILKPVTSTDTYPITNLSPGSSSFGVSADGQTLYAGGAEGLEIFKGTFANGDNHPDVTRQVVTNLYTSIPMGGDIVGHWAHDTEDVSGKGNDVQNNGNVDVVAALPGSEVWSYDFDDGNRLKDVANFYNLATELSAGAWVHSEAPANDDGGYIVSKKDSSKTDFALYRTTDNKLRSDGTAETLINAPILSGWNFVAVTFDGTNKRTYIDGVLVDTTADSKSSFDQVNQFIIGKRKSGNSNTEALDGKVSFPFLTSSHLDSNRIQEMYNQSSTWFTNNSKVTIQDSSSVITAMAVEDDGSYFAASENGVVTYFDPNGLVVKTFSNAANSSTNIQISGGSIVSLNVSDTFLIIGYANDGVEVVNIP